MRRSDSWNRETVEYHESQADPADGFYSIDLVIENTLTNGHYVTHVVYSFAHEQDDIVSSTLHHEYYRPDTDTWTEVPIDTAGDVGHPCDLAIDSQDQLHVVYYDIGAQALKYGFFDGAVPWHTQYVIQPGGANLGSSCSVTVDSDDHPHIAYYDATNGDLMHAQPANP